MKNIFLYLLVSVIFVLVGWFANVAYNLPRSSGNPISQVKPTPLAKYSIENLAQAKINPTEIQIGDLIKDYENFKSYKFFFYFDPSLSNKEPKKISGVINIPKGEGKYPAITMFRGYVDPHEYYMGEGTQPSATVFAKNGFITIAPDFLGYGESDKEAENIFESRFQTHTTAIEILKSISNLKNWDGKNIFIWGHSNGGQIALTTLEITSADYPSVLWAPVSKPFPYSILYYTDDASDSGKFLRAETFKFENDYDSDLYSLTKYLDKIKAPIQLNQGTADEAVPTTWSDLLTKNLKESNIDITYIKYPGADHNLRPNWNQAVENALNFYKKSIK
jgi:uncharacterized protein